MLKTTVHFGLAISPELNEAIKKLAEKSRYSKSAYVRNIMEDHVINMSNKDKKDEK